MGEVTSSKKSMVFLIFRLVAIIAMQQQQIIPYKRQHPRPEIRLADRLFWVIWPKLFKSLGRLSVEAPDGRKAQARRPGRAALRILCKRRDGSVSDGASACSAKRPMTSSLFLLGFLRSCGPG